MEIFGYSRDISSHLMQMVGQMQAEAQAQQDQSQNQMNQILAQAEVQRVEAKQREEAQRAEARQREEAQRAEAMKREELALAREQMLARMKAEAEEASQKREQALRKEKAEADEATRKREQLFMEHELKRQKVMVDATPSPEKLKADMHREIANLEAIERREAEFQQLQEKERERARDAQLKLWELAAQELKDRVHLEREFFRQQQQNLVLQKQREIDRLEAQAARNLFQQGQASSGRPAPKEKLATVREELATPSPEIAVELTDSDTTPPSQNRPKLAKRLPLLLVLVHR